MGKKILKMFSTSQSLKIISHYRSGEAPVGPIEVPVESVDTPVERSSGEWVTVTKKVKKNKLRFVRAVRQKIDRKPRHRNTPKRANVNMDAEAAKARFCSFPQKKEVV